MEKRCTWSSSSVNNIMKQKLLSRFILVPHACKSKRTSERHEWATTAATAAAEAAVRHRMKQVKQRTTINAQHELASERRTKNEPAKHCWIIGSTAVISKRAKQEASTTEMWLSNMTSAAKQMSEQISSSLLLILVLKNLNMILSSEVLCQHLLAAKAKNLCEIQSSELCCNTSLAYWKQKISVRYRVTNCKWWHSLACLKQKYQWGTESRLWCNLSLKVSLWAKWNSIFPEHTLEAVD